MPEPLNLETIQRRHNDDTTFGLSVAQPSDLEMEARHAHMDRGLLPAEVRRLREAILEYLDAPASGVVDHGALEERLRRMANGVGASQGGPADTILALVTEVRDLRRALEYAASLPCSCTAPEDAARTNCVACYAKNASQRWLAAGISDASPKEGPMQPALKPVLPPYRTCAERGCSTLVSSSWSPYFCPPHDAERVDRISKSLKEIEAGFSAPVSEAKPEGGVDA